MIDSTTQQADPADRVSTEVVMATLLRPDGSSGVQSHMRTFHEYLAAAARPVSVVNPFSSRARLLAPVFGARLGIRRISPPAGVWWYRHWHAHYLQRALAVHLAERPDAVVYAQCPVSAAVALRVRTRQPVVMAAHLNISQAEEWAGKGEIQRYGDLFRSIQSFEQSVLGELDGIVYVSEFTRAQLEERIPALAKVPGVVVPNPVTVSDSPVRELVPTADLVTVGGLESRKNQGYLLEVLAAAGRRGHRYTLTLVGDGPDRAGLEAKARQLGLTGQVRFAGYRQDPRGLIRAHRLYCHTATMESFGIVLVEAMAEGLPVLAAAVGGVPEVVRSGLEGLHWPLDDVDAAADVLVGLMRDDAGRARMAAAARSRASTVYSAEVVGRQLVAFLDRVEARTATT